MTAQVIALFPVGEDADDVVRRTIRAVMAFRQLSVEGLADKTGLATATLYRRFGGNGGTQAFKAGEVATIAHALNVRPGELYDGLGDRFTPEPTPPAQSSTSALDALAAKKRSRSSGGSPTSDEYLAA